MAFDPFHIVVAFLADLVFGDPRGMPHPVRWIGRIINWQEGLLYTLKLPFLGSSTPKALTLKGAILVAGTITFTVLPCWLALTVMPSFLAEVFSIWLAFTLIAVKSLAVETGKVIKSLEKGDLERARKELSWIVSRDTKHLDERSIIKATLETLSENISDGIVAPIFYMAIAGPIGGLLYKTINTLDSMVGYKNERYFYFGKVSAKLDDIFNLLPARISGILITTACWILEKLKLDKTLSAKRALIIMLRDGRLLESPNAGIPQSAMAGALGVSLGGQASYFGKIVEKPVMGDPLRDVSPEVYRLALVIMYSVSVLAVVLGAMFLAFRRW